MNLGLRQRTSAILHKTFGPRFERLAALLTIPAPDKPQLLYRIQRMERGIILPLKAAGIIILLASFYLSPWIGITLSEFDIAIESTQYFLWIYIGINAIVAGLLFAMRLLPLPLMEWAVFTISLIDGIFLSALMLVTGGADSLLYWLFLALIIRSSVSIPRPASQLMLDLALCAYYLLASIIYIKVAENLDENSRHLMDVPDHPAEQLFLRLIVLLLTTASFYAIQVLLQRQRQALEHAHEFAAREGQLHSVGRLAAEFAHQIKNPLAIINNAAFSLQRALREGRPIGAEEIAIIQEEVQRSDRIITQVMGYAQLNEGHVETLSVVEELDRAVEQVFPAGARFPVRIHRDYGGQFPPLLMQRRHASETFKNLLQNAREALDGRGGTLVIHAHCAKDHSIEVSIEDDGPGIPPEQQVRIFEPYYTTKAKGTGLGLATVKHNVELYGGNIRVESGLGKGARFVLLFPGRTHMKLEPNAP